MVAALGIILVHIVGLLLLKSMFPKEDIAS